MRRHRPATARSLASIITLFDLENMNDLQAIIATEALASKMKGTTAYGRRTMLAIENPSIAVEEGDQRKVRQTDGLPTGLQAAQQPETVKEIITDTHPTENPLCFGQTNHRLAAQTTTPNIPGQLKPSDPRHRKTLTAKTHRWNQSKSRPAEQIPPPEHYDLKT